MEEVNDDFKQRVYALVAQIPRGRVMTYGQLAALAGSPYAARIVGGIAHWGDPDLPWQRVVMKDGGLAPGYPGGTAGHAEALKAEGVSISKDFKVENMAERLWRPAHPDQNSLL
jgi:methylated-DNA-protein-cysteine methyltransferase related protein